MCPEWDNLLRHEKISEAFSLPATRSSPPTCVCEKVTGSTEFDYFVSEKIKINRDDFTEVCK